MTMWIRTMLRVARIASVIALAVLGAASVVRAQTTPAAGTTDSQFYAEFTLGPTLGHQSSSLYGGEGGVRLTRDFAVFFEGGHMRNVGTKDLDTRALQIANFIGGTSSTASRVNYFDVGARYNLPLMIQAPFGEKWQTFALFGVGAAHVTNASNFHVAGSDVTNQLFDLYGVQLGSDLSGHFTKPFVTLGFGLDVTFAKRYFGELTYRYGHISKDTAGSGDVDLAAINTQRVQFGFGIHF
jgi:opacity protein-like surface antigen